MNKHFVLFRDGRRLRAAHHEFPEQTNSFTFGDRQFLPSGRLIHISHIVDSTDDLLGFSLDSLEAVSNSPEWKLWWDSFDNRTLVDFWQATIFLADPLPANWRDDGALLVVGGQVFSDQHGEYILVLPDENGYQFHFGKPTSFWRKLGFELARPKIRLAH